MENRQSTGNGLHSKTALSAVMFVFCILALIEIIYGRLQLKAAREQIAENEAQIALLEELKETAGEEPVWDNALTEPDMAEEGQDAALTEPETQEGSQNAETENPDASGTDSPGEEEREYEMQIVFMGDSILDNARGSDGVAALIGEGCNAKIYNLAMGGTTAALLPEEQYDFNAWTSRSLLGVVNAIIGNIDTSVFQGYRAGEIMNECDFSKTDYFVIEYGINDFFSKLPNNRYLSDGVTRIADDAHTYVGALELAVTLLHGVFPDAKIIICAPHYCQFFSAEFFIGDSYSMNNDYGPLVSYGGLCDYVYEQHKKENVLLYKPLDSSDIDAYTADEYLEDGIHLSEAGRKAYAEPLIKKILSDFKPVE